jgi:hypothetical protein
MLHLITSLSLHILFLRMVVQTALQRFSFDKYLLCRVEYTLRYHDPCKLGLVDRETLRSTLKGAKLPVSRQILDFLVDKYKSPYNLHSLFVSTMTVPIKNINSLCSFDSADECGRINYCCFMQYLDWVENAAPKALPSHERVSKIIIILITTLVFKHV